MFVWHDDGAAVVIGILVWAQAGRHNTQFGGIGQTDCLPRTARTALASVLHKNRHTDTHAHAQIGTARIAFARAWVVRRDFVFRFVFFAAVCVFGFGVTFGLMNGRHALVILVASGTLGR